MRDCLDCPELIVVGPGQFDMGAAPDEEAALGLPAGKTAREQPRHRVTIPRALAVGRYEVTRDQFARFVRETGHGTGDSCSIVVTAERLEPRAGHDWRDPGFAQTGRDPVVCVSWQDAAAYVDWLSRLTGQRYRLPTEAEWEYVARAGVAAPKPWADDHQACTHANVRDRSFGVAMGTTVGLFPCSDDFAATAPVGSFRPNEFGVFDALGNAWEWVADCGHDSHAGAPADGTARSGPPGCRHVDRGGGWSSVTAGVRLAERYLPPDGTRVSFLGFRVVREISPPSPP